jgi:hypothetical protein
LRTTVEGFSFSDFCLRCQKVTEHKVQVDDKHVFGSCQSCGEQRPMIDLNQVYYEATKLWVTRFKIGNLPSVVTGKLLDAVKGTH